MKRVSRRIMMIVVPVILSLLAGKSFSKPDPNFHCYLLFGQSNMAGGMAGLPYAGAGGSGAGVLIDEDCDTSEWVEVLAFCDCSAGSGAACKQYNSTRKADQWYTAFPALHICNEGVSPGDYFAKTLLDSISEDINIGLIPCALSGQALKVFTKGGSNFGIPNWAHPTLGNTSPYAWMVERCKIAQERGVIKGILLHQGESGSGSGEAWHAMAGRILDDLKADLDLPDSLPVVVGELRADNYGPFNQNSVGALAENYPHCAVASSQGVSVQSDDQWHFDAAGMRELGKRFAVAFLGLSSQDYIPRVGTTATLRRVPTFHQTINGSGSALCVFSLNGRAVSVVPDGQSSSVVRQLPSDGLYILSRTLEDGRTAVVPYIR